MRRDPGPLEALLRLRELAAGRSAAALAGLLRSLRAEEAALQERLAALDAARRRAGQAAEAPARGEAAGLRAAARFRERLRILCELEAETARAQRERVRASESRVAAGRAALAAAEARREAVSARLRRLRAARRAAREAALDEEGDGIALAAPARAGP